MIPRNAISKVGTSSRGCHAGKRIPSEHWSTRWGVEFCGVGLTSGGSARATTQQAASAASAGRMPRYAPRLSVRAMWRPALTEAGARLSVATLLAPHATISHIAATREGLGKRRRISCIKLAHVRCEPFPPLMEFYYRGGQ